MIKFADSDPEFVRLARQKYNNINNRCRNRKSYKDKNITNEFSFPEFLAYARLNGLEHGKHCHRPNRYGNYCSENLVFISEAEHLKISGLERRKLNQDQIQEVIELSGNMSLRKIAKRFGVSHVTIYRYLKMEQDDKSTA